MTIFLMNTLIFDKLDSFWLYNKLDDFDRITLVLREEPGQINVILHYELLAAILSAVCSVIQQS